jgi:leucine-rich repeat transmembrane protein FLRT
MDLIFEGTTVTGIWTNWSDWSPCNAKCGQGFKRRIRTCTSVSPKDNGFDCNGNGTETVQCQNRECSGKSPYAMFSNCKNDYLIV